MPDKPSLNGLKSNLLSAPGTVPFTPIEISAYIRGTFDRPKAVGRQLAPNPMRQPIEDPYYVHLSHQCGLAAMQ